MSERGCEAVRGCDYGCELGTSFHGITTTVAFGSAVTSITSVSACTCSFTVKIAAIGMDSKLTVRRTTPVEAANAEWRDVASRESEGSQSAFLFKGTKVRGRAPFC